MKILDAANQVSGGNVRRFIRRKREARWSYQTITRALGDQYGVDVTDTTVRDFCIDHDIP